MLARYFNRQYRSEFRSEMQYSRVGFARDTRVAGLIACHVSIRKSDRNLAARGASLDQVANLAT